jgi:hypothetical protein
MRAKVISLEKCREIMKENGIEYTDEELLTLRDFLYRLFEISNSHYERIKEREAKVIDINQKDYEKNSIPLCKSEHRRAS